MIAPIKRSASMAENSVCFFVSIFKDRETRLIFADLSFNRAEDLLGIEAHSMFKDPDDLADVLNVFRDIAIDDYQLRGLADFDGADIVLESQCLCAIVGCDTYRLYRREAGLRK